MINWMSKEEDIKFLSHKLKEKLGDKISINTYELSQEVLNGKFIFDKKDTFKYNGVDFHIKYSANEFLRINVGEIEIYKHYMEKVEALLEITKALSKITTKEGAIIGNPLAFYYIETDGYFTPYCDWAFTNQEEYKQELINNTMYDDAKIENLIIYEQVPEIHWPILKKEIK